MKCSFCLKNVEVDLASLMLKEDFKLNYFVYDNVKYYCEYQDGQFSALITPLTFEDLKEKMYHFFKTSLEVPCMHEFLYSVRESGIYISASDAPDFESGILNAETNLNHIKEKDIFPSEEFQERLKQREESQKANEDKMREERRAEKDASDFKLFQELKKKFENNKE